MYPLHCTTLSRLSKAKKKTNDLTFLRYLLFCYFLHRQLQSKKTNQIRKKVRQTLDSCTIYTIYLQAIYINLVTVCRQPPTYVTSMLTSFAKKLTILHKTNKNWISWPLFSRACRSPCAICSRSYVLLHFSCKGKSLNRLFSRIL